jgi:hypothetical protein
MEDMLKPRGFFLINQTIVFWLKIIKIETKNFCYSKILKIYYPIPILIPESIAINMFIDDETTKFKLKFVGREDITTKFELCHLWSLSRWCNQACF